MAGKALREWMRGALSIGHEIKASLRLGIGNTKYHPRVASNSARSYCAVARSYNVSRRTSVGQLTHALEIQPLR